MTLTADNVVRRRLQAGRNRTLVFDIARASDLQQRVHREPLGVFGRVLFVGPAITSDGGMFAKHVAGRGSRRKHAQTI